MHDLDLIAAVQQSAPGSTPADIADMLGLRPPAWHRDALCREHVDLEWFPERAESIAEQREVCFRCLVRVECLEYALSADKQLAGVWGGTSHTERRRLR